MRTLAYWLSLLILFTFPWEDMFVFPGLGSLSRLVGLSVALFWVVTVLVTRRVRRIGVHHVLATLFVLWNMLSLLWSQEQNRTMDRLVTYVQLIGLVYLLWDLLHTRARLTAGIQAYIFGAYVGLISQLFNFANGIEAYEFAHGRFSATNTNPNEFGLILALGIPLAWHLATGPAVGGWQRLARVVNYIFIPMAFFGILLTASRGSLAATAPGLLFMVLTMGRVNRSIRVLFFLAAVGALGYFAQQIPAQTLQRFATTGSHARPDEFSLNGRLQVWGEGLQTFTRHPVIGVGSSAFRVTVDSGIAPHNTFLSVLVDLGLVGFLLFAGMITLAFYHILRLPRPRAALWLVILATWGIGAMVHNWEHTKHTWLFLTLIAIAYDQAVVGRGQLPVISTQTSVANYQKPRLTDPLPY